MPCDPELRALLSRFLDGELSTEDRSRVEQHLSACAACKKFYEILVRNEALLAGALSDEFGGNKVGSIRHSIPQSPLRKTLPKKENPARLGVTFWLGLTAAALVLAILQVVFFIRQSNQMESMRASIEGVKEQIASNASFRRRPESVSAYLKPEESMRIFCELLAETKDQGDFRIERSVEGKPVSARFHLALGQTIGRKVMIEKFGIVDFTTDLVLERIEEGTEPLTIRYTRPLCDAAGNPVLRRTTGGALVPETEEIEEILGTRLNRRAVLRKAAQKDMQATVVLWKDGWIWATAQ